MVVDKDTKESIFFVQVSKKDEFCIQNEKLCIKNEKLCIKNEKFCVKNDEFCRSVPV